MCDQVIMMINRPKFIVIPFVSSKRELYREYKMTKNLGLFEDGMMTHDNSESRRDYVTKYPPWYRDPVPSIGN